MVYTVKSNENYTFSLCEDDEVKAVLQNIQLILTTPKGSVPMYREFGLEQDFIDKPIPVAQTLMTSRIREALEMFEPRAKFVGITFSEETPGKLIPILEVEITV